MIISVQNQQSSFWNLPLTSNQSQLNAGPTGLTGEDARRRITAIGPNTLQTHPRRALLLQFAARFGNPLVIVLLVASGVAALTGDVVSFVIIGVIVLISVTLDFVQEYQAGRAAERLRLSVTTRVTVVRDGRKIDVNMADIVPGDTVLLSAGNLVPADGRVLEAKDFFVNQSLLTGESYPVEKHSGDLPAPTDDISKVINAVFMGSSVISGAATVMICRTGSATALGSIAESLATKAPANAFEIGTHQFGMLIMRLTILLVLFVLLINTLLHRPLLESFLFAVALAVGLTPELLPMVVSVTLARGALRMAKKDVVVKRLAAIHNLGGMDVLCTDKTGTLTQACIHLERHIDADGQDSTQVLTLAYLNSYFETGLKSPLDDAILEHKEIDVSSWHKLDEVPFDFERRRVSVLVDNSRERLLVVKGAPEDILRLCTHHAVGREQNPASIDVQTLARLQALRTSLETEGFRVLGVAWRNVAPDHPHAVVSDEAGLVFAGFAAFLDPPKASAAAALKSLAASGVTIKIVTGDSELVTQHVCGLLGLPIHGMLTGEAIQHLDDQALQVQAENNNLFCRVTPTQKNRIILALKARGHTVGYLGDGINDAPSLHSADVGISVDSAVDIAKEAAEIILLKQDLNVLYDGVLEGRRTFGNIMKYIMMGTSSNFGNMFSMAGASLFLPFLPMLPVQILLNNLLYDISEIAIPLDHVDQEYLEKPRHWDMRFIRNFMWVVGPVSSVFDILTFFIMLRFFQAGPALFRTGWFIESIATQVLVIFIIRTRRRPWRSVPNVWLSTTSLVIVIAAMALPFTPIGSYFDFVAPPPLFFLILLGLLLCYLFAAEAVKQYFYRRYASR
ncbi:MAG: magnesium-translocating P-type ATPase [Gammaproteobacteria bacterium]|nr:magnesium-translocating P-type ATPase [Gammaproteobacteria bacterium]